VILKRELRTRLRERAKAVGDAVSAIAVDLSWCFAKEYPSQELAVDLEKVSCAIDQGRKEERVCEVWVVGESEEVPLVSDEL
jgi:hypothetical protein